MGLRAEYRTYPGDGASLFLVRGEEIGYKQAKSMLVPELIAQGGNEAKDKYDAAVAELEKLIKKRDELRNKELLKAFAESEKSFDEVMDFLRGGDADE